MAKRPSAHPKLARQPLAFVLAQLVFSPILKMDKYIGDLQETFRKDFPGFEHEKVVQLAYTPSPELRETPRWILSNKERTGAITIGQDFAVYETTEYGGFEESFSKTLERLAGEIERLTSPEIIRRLGLRYVNVIRETDGKPPSELVQPPFRSLADCFSKVELEGDVPSETETFSVITKAWTERSQELKIKCRNAASGSFMPYDLSQTRIQFPNNDGPDIPDPFWSIDLDGIWRGGEDFSVSFIRTQAEELHEVIGEAFRSTVTDEALDLWKRE